MQKSYLSKEKKPIFTSFSNTFLENKAVKIKKLVFFEKKGRVFLNTKGVIPAVRIDNQECGLKVKVIGSSGGITSNKQYFEQG